VSAIYTGRLRHVRTSGVRHSFTMRLFMLYLDLDELAAGTLTRALGVERPGLLSFRRRDYLGDHTLTLKSAVLAEVERALGFRPAGPVRVLTQVRALGYVFNPVTFYYCFDAAETLQAVVAEITNTPWSERHRYVLRSDELGAHQRFAKNFHVSPFFGMNQDYDWRFSAPSDRLSVRMSNVEDGKAVFQATLTMRRRPLTAEELARAFVGHPLMTWKVHLAIYAHALVLWLKGAPFFEHPGARALEEKV